MQNEVTKPRMQKRSMETGFMGFTICFGVILGLLFIVVVSPLEAAFKGKYPYRAGTTVGMVADIVKQVPSYFDYVVLMNMRIVAHGATNEIFTEENLKKTYGGKLTLLSDAVYAFSKDPRLPACFSSFNRATIALSVATSTPTKGSSIM